MSKSATNAKYWSSTHSQAIMYIKKCNIHVFTWYVCITTLTCWRLDQETLNMSNMQSVSTLQFVLKFHYTRHKRNVKFAIPTSPRSSLVSCVKVCRKSGISVRRLENRSSVFRFVSWQNDKGNSASWQATNNKKFHMYKKESFSRNMHIPA